jgi:ribosomal peptide maturation radical SAM protein 1
MDTRSKSAKIALINMPFASSKIPSIQCGLLKSALVRAGHIADVYYLNLELCSELGPEHYQGISDGRYASLLGEWLFSSAAFGYSGNEKEYFSALPERDAIGQQFDFQWLVDLRKNVLPAFIREWAKKADWGRYHAVGFTSTFVQNNACFALARSIKENFPHVQTVFGGANFDGGMGREFLRKLPFIDYVVDGEGEQAIVELANCLAKGEPAIGIQGISARTSKGIYEGGRSAKIGQMDCLPAPDYDEYFESLWRLGKERILGGSSTILLMETARGCWWGEKHHCTFCGLNASDMAFRSKSPERVLEELRELARRYQTLNFFIIDNIMNMKYVEKVCAPLIGKHSDYKLFWEVKANLTPQHLKAMADSGIVEVQPGIESLSTHVLALMRKGISMLKNVRFLKWANYFGINTGWNILAGFPEETEEDYVRQRKLIPLLKHLQPPGGWGRIWLERYSPYFFDRSFPIADIKPLEAYRFVYPEEIDPQEIAYFFEYRVKTALPVERHEEIFNLLKEWKAAWEKTPRPILKYRRGPGWMEIIDRREEQARTHWLYGVEASIYEFCGETDRTAETALRNLREETGKGELEEVQAALTKCCDLGIMIEEDGHYLSLAQPLNRNWFAKRGTIASGQHSGETAIGANRPYKSPSNPSLPVLTA